MSTTLAAAPARLAEFDVGRAVVGVADTLADALPDRQATERLVETIAATVATRVGRRRARGIRGFMASHPRIGLGLAVALVAVIVALLVRRSRRATTEESAEIRVAA
jgi:hypothetical protein